MRVQSRLAVVAMILCLASRSDAQDAAKIDIVERGVKATVFVEVATQAGGASGSGFCIDKSGLFITNAHVVENATSVKLIIDIGQKSQRKVTAEILRTDAVMDLALLKAAPDTTLTALELSDIETPKLTQAVTTFGFPFGKMLATGDKAPDITVIRSNITSHRTEDEKHRYVQFDGQLNPGNSGGPVLDDEGRVVGVAVATVRGAAMNLAIRVKRLSEFLEAPTVVFEPPPLDFKDRALPVNWTITVKPPTPNGKLPAGLAVTVKITAAPDDERVYNAASIGGGVYKVKVTPVARDQGRRVTLDVQYANGESYQIETNDAQITIGGKRYVVSDLRRLHGGTNPWASTIRGTTVRGAIGGLGKVKTKVGQKTVTVDLSAASQISITPMSPPDPLDKIQAVVELKAGTKVLATVAKYTTLANAPRPAATTAIVRVMPSVNGRRVITVTPVDGNSPAGGGSMTSRNNNQRGNSFDDADLIKIGGKLEIDGTSRGGRASIKPPAIDINSAQVTVAPTDDSGPPLTRTLDDKISDVVVGGGGRYLLLVMKGSQKLAVFDVNKADVVKTIPLPSPNVLVAAGAKKFIVAFPDEKLIQTWNLETMTREVANGQLPMTGRLKGLAMGSDSDGPALALWSVEGGNPVVGGSRYSFIDIDSLTALKAGQVVTPGPSGSTGTSTTGGSFTLSHMSTDQMRIRASSGGDLYAMWQSNLSPNGVQILQVQGDTLNLVYNHDSLGYLAPGPDGSTVFTAKGGRLDANGKPVGRTGPAESGRPDPTIPSTDSAFYLTLTGPALTPGQSRGRLHLTVNGAGSGAKLLTVYAVDEMTPEIGMQTFGKDEFSLDKRIHYIPAANLLITIPTSNDRLVLRSLNLEQSLRDQKTDFLFVTTPSSLTAKSGEALEHQIEARSSAGAVTYSLTQGPTGLTVSPEGKVSWPKPRELNPDQMKVIVTVGDSSGREVFHRLRLSVK